MEPISKSTTGSCLAEEERTVGSSTIFVPASRLEKVSHPAWPGKRGQTGSSQASTPSPACFLHVTHQVPPYPGDSLLPSVVILVLALFFLPGDQSLPDTGHTQPLPLCSEAISCKDSSQGRSQSPGTEVRTWAGQGSCYCLLWLSA